MAIAGALIVPLWTLTLDGKGATAYAEAGKLYWSTFDDSAAMWGVPDALYWVPLDWERIAFRRQRGSAGRPNGSTPPFRLPTRPTVRAIRWAAWIAERVVVEARSVVRARAQVGCVSGSGCRRRLGVERGVGGARSASFGGTDCVRYGSWELIVETRCRRGAAVCDSHAMLRRRRGSIPSDVAECDPVAAWCALMAGGTACVCLVVADWKKSDLDRGRSTYPRLLRGRADEDGRFPTPILRLGHARNGAVIRGRRRPFWRAAPSAYRLIR
jgi:hypothetical protein